MDMIYPTKPESNFQLIRRSLILYRVSFRHVFLLAFLLSVIVFIPRLLSDLIGQDIYRNVAPTSFYRLWLLLVNLIAIMFFIAVIWRMNGVNRGYHEPIREDFTVGVKKMFAVFIGSLIQSLVLFLVLVITFAIQMFLYKQQLLFRPDLLGIVLTAIIFILQFLLLLYVMMLFIFLTPLIAIENRGILAALERSVLLAWNHWWRIFTLQLTPWVFYLIFLFLLRLVFQIPVHIYFLGDRAHSLWVTLLQIILFAFFIPWIAALLLVQLRDLELRKHITETEKNAL